MSHCLHTISEIVIPAVSNMLASENLATQLKSLYKRVLTQIVLVLEENVLPHFHDLSLEYVSIYTQVLVFRLLGSIIAIMFTGKQTNSCEQREPLLTGPSRPTKNNQVKQQQKLEQSFRDMKWRNKATNNGNLKPTAFQDRGLKLQTGIMMNQMEQQIVNIKVDQKDLTTINSIQFFKVQNSQKVNRQKYTTQNSNQQTPSRFQISNNSPNFSQELADFSMNSLIYTKKQSQAKIDEKNIKFQQKKIQEKVQSPIKQIQQSKQKDNIGLGNKQIEIRGQNKLVGQRERQNLQQTNIFNLTTQNKVPSQKQKSKVELQSSKQIIGKTSDFNKILKKLQQGNQCFNQQQKSQQIKNKDQIIKNKKSQQYHRVQPPAIILPLKSKPQQKNTTENIVRHQVIQNNKQVNNPLQNNHKRNLTTPINTNLSNNDIQITNNVNETKTVGLKKDHRQNQANCEQNSVNFTLLQKIISCLRHIIYLPTTIGRFPKTMANQNNKSSQYKKSGYVPLGTQLIEQNNMQKYRDYPFNYLLQSDKDIQNYLNENEILRNLVLESTNEDSYQKIKTLIKSNMKATRQRAKAKNTIRQQKKLDKNSIMLNKIQQIANKQQNNKLINNQNSSSPNNKKQNPKDQLQKYKKDISQQKIKQKDRIYKQTIFRQIKKMRLYQPSKIPSIGNHHMNQSRNIHSYSQSNSQYLKQSISRWPTREVDFQHDLMVLQSNRRHRQAVRQSVQFKVLQVQVYNKQIQQLQKYTLKVPISMDVKLVHHK